MDIRTCFYAIAGVPTQSSSVNGVCIYANGTWKEQPHTTKRNVICGGNGEWAYQYLVARSATNVVYLTRLLCEIDYLVFRREPHSVRSGNRLGALRAGNYLDPPVISQ